MDEEIYFCKHCNGLIESFNEAGNHQCFRGKDHIYQDEEDNTIMRLNNITTFVQSMEPQKIREPPKYSSPTHLCDFCNTSYPEDTFIKHLIVEHSELLFHCEQCGKYLNRRQFITHMSLHAVHYTGPLDEKLHETKQDDDVNLDNSTVLSIAPNNDSALTRNNEGLNTIPISICHPNTIPLRSDHNVNTDVTCEDTIAPTTSADNSNKSVLETKKININKAIVFPGSPSTKQKTHDTLNSPDIKITSPITKENKNKLRSCNQSVPRSTITEITLPITRHHISNTYAQVRRKRVTNSENTKCKTAGARKQNANITNAATQSQNTSAGTAKTLTKTPQHSKTSKLSSEDEFSDQSDVEYGFGRLPESVFEAIEDTQDSQSVEDINQAADIVNLDDESNSETTDNKFQLPLPKKSRTCPICSKVYKASSSYFYHLKHTHKKVKEHECPTCAKKFATRASLATHRTIHTGECQFECKHCQKRFKSNASLYIHEQTHIGVKTFSCKQCETSFRWRTHLQRHMKRHSAEKNHVCSTCGRGFSIRCDLLRHARTHTAGQFPCEECDAKFAQMRYLKVHMERKHSKKAVKK